MTAETTRAVDTVDCVEGNKADSRADPVEGTDLFINIFHSMYGQCWKGHMTEEIGKLSVELASDVDLAQMQSNFGLGYTVAIAPVGSGSTPSN